MKKLSIILIIAMVGISLPVFALFVDNAKCPGGNLAWDEDMKECVPIGGNYKCCDAEFEAEACAKKNPPQEFDDERCECKENTCGFDENGMCGGTCAMVADRYGDLTRTQSCVSYSSSTCECCPDDVIRSCGDEGGVMQPGCECIVESTTTETETETISETTISVGDEISSTSFDDEVVTSIGGDGDSCDGVWFEGPNPSLSYCCPRDVVDSCQGRIEVQVLMAGHECVCVDDTFSSTMK